MSAAGLHPSVAAESALHVLCTPTDVNFEVVGAFTSKTPILPVGWQEEIPKPSPYPRAYERVNCKRNIRSANACSVNTTLPDISGHISK